MENLTIDKEIITCRIDVLKCGLHTSKCLCSDCKLIWREISGLLFVIDNSKKENIVK